MASVNLNNNKSLYASHEAGATFINQNFLLTAGHVVTAKNGNLIKPESIKIAYGGLDLKKTTAFNIFKVKAVYRYSDYFTIPSSGNIAVNDVGLIEIENHPSIKVKTVQLVKKDNAKELTKVGNTTTIIGWGFSEAFVAVSQYLRWSNETIKSDQETNNYINSLPEMYWNTYYSEAMIASESKKMQRSTQGDSGGPELVYDNKTKQYIEIGICSWCPDVPNTGWDFYTRLSNPLYLQWINNIINHV